MSKNKGFSFDFPPGKKKSKDYTDHENPDLTLAQEASLAREAVKNSPAGTTGISIGEEQAKVRDLLKSGGGSDPGEEDPMKPASNPSTSDNLSFEAAVPKEKLSNASESPYAPVIKPRNYGAREQSRPVLYHSDEAEPSIAGEPEALSTMPVPANPSLALDDVTKEYQSLRDSGTIPNGVNGAPLSPVEYIQARFKGEIESPVSPTESLPQDATHGEIMARKRKLQERLTGIERVEGERQLSATELYDMRVDLFASKHGLKDSLESMRTARQAYFEARKLGLTRGYDEDNLGDLKQEYDRSVFGWKTTLETMSDSLDGKDRAEALIIAKRDSLLGPNNLELEARKAALSEKGKTAFGKAEIWMGNVAKLPLTLPGFVFGQAGKGLAHLLNANSYEIPKSSKKVSPERLKELRELTPKQRKALSEAAEADYARKYARAVGVLAGAGIATTLALIASPVAATGAFLTFTAYAARGAVGTLAGMGAANATGGIFNKFFGNKRAEKLDTWLQKRPTTLEEYQEQQQAYKRNNSRVRAGERSAWKMVAAMLTGSGVGLASSPLTHDFLQHIGQLEGVQGAAKVVAEANANSAGAAEHALRVQEMAKTAEAASAHAAAPHVEPYSVSIDPGEGMDRLFVELRDHYKEIYPDPNAATVPPGIRHILNAHSGDELSREFGFINGENTSYTMSKDDSLGFDAQGNLVFTPSAEGAQSIELLKEGPTGITVPHHLTAAEQQGHFIRHAEASMAGTHPSPEAHVTSATTVPEAQNTDAMLNRLQTAHPSELVGHEEVLRAEPGRLGAADIHSYEAPTVSDSAPETSIPEQSPVAHVEESQPVPTPAPETYTPEESPAAPVAESQPAPAPEKPEPAPAPAVPETPSAPAQAPESVTAHAFAEPGAPEAINPHGVDLNQPQLLSNNGLKFAHGIDTDDSYSRAYTESLRLFGEGAKDTNVYFVARDYDALGNPYLVVRMVFTPPDGSTPQMAPYGEGVSLSPEFTMPPVPKDSDYKPLS